MAEKRRSVLADALEYNERENGAPPYLLADAAKVAIDDARDVSSDVAAATIEREAKADAPGSLLFMQDAIREVTGGVEIPPGGPISPLEEREQAQRELDELLVQSGVYRRPPTRPSTRPKVPLPVWLSQENGVFSRAGRELQRDNQEKTQLDVSKLDPRVQQFLAENPAAAAVVKNDPYLATVFSDAEAALFLIENEPSQRRLFLWREIRRNGYTKEQLAELEANGFTFRRDANGKPIRGEDGGFYTQRTRGSEIFTVRDPIMEHWYMTPQEIERRAIHIGGQPHPEEAIRNESNPEVLRQRINNLLLTSTAILAARERFGSLDPEKVSDADLRTFIDQLGSALGVDTSLIHPLDLRPRTAEEANFNLAVPFRQEGVISEEDVATTLHGLRLNRSSVPELQDAAILLTRQVNDLRGSTTGNKWLEGVLTTVGYGAELYATSLLVPGGGDASLKTLVKAKGLFKGILAGLGLAAKQEAWRLMYYAPKAIEAASHTGETLAFKGKDGETVVEFNARDFDDRAVAFANSLAETYLANLSERMGDAFSLIPVERFAKMIPSGVKKAWFARFISEASEKVGKSKMGLFLDHLKKGTSWNGILPEYVEEKINDLFLSASTWVAQLFDSRFGDFGNVDVFGTWKDEALLMSQIAPFSVLFSAPSFTNSARNATTALRGVEAQRRINEEIEKTFTGQKSPTTMEALLREVNKGRDTVYMDAETATSLAEDPEIAEAIAADSEAMIVAQEQGARLSLSLARLQSRLRGEKFDSVIRKVSFDPQNTMTAEEAEKLDLSEEAATAAAKRVEDARAAFREAIEKLQSLGLTPVELRAASKLLSMADYFAANTVDRALSAADWIRNVAFDKMKEADWLKKFNTQPTGGGALDALSNDGVSPTFNDTWKAAITVFEGSMDAATIPRELAKYATLMMNRLVNSGLANQRMIDDWNALSAWAKRGTKSVAEVQEKLAKGFEAYIMEGKAPVDVQGAFAGLRRLMLTIYKSVKAIGVTINADVRRVFDGMLTADGTLHDNSVLTGFEGIDTGLLGLTADETKTIRGLIGKMNDQALTELIGEREAELKKLRKQWAKEADAEMNGNPLYIAQKLIDDVGGLDYLAVEEIAGPYLAQKLRERGLTTNPGRLSSGKVNAKGESKSPGGYNNAEPGVHPAEVAAAADFESAEQLLEELLNAKPRKAYKDNYLAEREREFNERFRGSEGTHGTEAAVEAAELLSLKLAQQAKQQDFHERRAVLVQRIRKEMDAMPVGAVLSNSKLVGDAKKNARDLTKAVNDGNYAVAFSASTRLRGNIETLRQQAEAKKEIARVEKILKKAVSAKSGVIEGKYQGALRDIYERFFVTDRRRAPKHSGALGSLLAELEEGASALDDATFSVGELILDGSMKYRQLTVEQFRELGEVIQWLDGEGRRVVTEAESLRKEGGKQKAITATEEIVVSHGGDYHYRKGLVHGWRVFVNWSKKLRTIIHRATGGKENAVLRQSYDDMALAASEQMQLSAEPTRICNEALRELFRLTKKLDFSSINDIRFPDMVARRGYKWNPERVVAACLNMGNAKNRQRLIDGYEWGDNGESYCDRIASLLPLEAWTHIQAIWDAIGKGRLAARVRDTFRQEMHFELRQEEALPFTVRTSDGAVYEAAGGYYPLSYLYHNNQKVQDVVALGARNPSVQRRESFTFERAALVKDPLNLSLNIIPLHIYNAAHYATHRAVMREFMRIIKDSRFRDTFQKNQGFETYDALVDLAKNVADPKEALKGVVDEFEQWARSLVTATALWGSPRTMFMQFASTTVGIDELGGYYIEALGEVWARPTETYRFITSKSGVMRDRVGMRDIDLRGAVNVFGRNKFQRGVDAIRKIGYTPMQLTDRAVSMPIWLGAYKKALAEGVTDERAVARADEAVAASQGAARPIDMSQIQLKAWGRGLTLFYSAASAAWDSQVRTGYKLATGQYANFTQATAAIACNYLIPWGLGAVIAALLTGSDDDDPDKAERAFYRELLSAPFQGVAIVRELSSFLAGGIAREMTGKNFYRGKEDILESTSLRGINDLLLSMVDSVVSLAEGNPARFAYKFADSLGAIYRVPVVPAYKKIRRLLDDVFGLEVFDPEEEIKRKKKNRRLYY